MNGPRDGLWACLAAAVLLGIAALIVFVLHPGGPQSQVAVYSGLLPGSIAGAMLAGFAQGAVPGGQRAVYLLSLVLFSFLWYFILAFIVVKIGRAVSQARKA